MTALPRVAFWLIPEPAVYTVLDRQIDVLAKWFSSVPFVPHVTIYSCYRSVHDEEVTLAGSLARQIGEVSVEVDCFAGTAEMTKAYYLQLSSSPALLSLNQLIHDSVPKPSGYTLDPHLSLLYQKITDDEREELLKGESAGFKTISFSELWVVAIPEALKVMTDFDGWQILFRGSLASGENAGTI